MHDQLTAWLFRRLGAGHVSSPQQQYVPYEMIYALRPDRKFLTSGDDNDCGGHGWWVAHTLETVLGALPAVSAPTDLVAAWVLSDAAVEEARQRLREERSGIHRHRPVPRVLGMDYELPDGDFYRGLGAIADQCLDPTTKPGFSPTRPAELAGLRPSPTSGPRAMGTARLPRSTRKDEVVGALGEYLTWREIQAMSGGRIRKDAWCSTNRLHFLDDGLPGANEYGYDFAFQLGGTHYEIEVKTTRSKQTNQIRLGPTEVHQTEYRAQQSRGPVWQVWLVTDALSNPVFHALGNPFSAQHRSRVEVLQMGVMLRFKLEQG